MTTELNKAQKLYMSMRKLSEMLSKDPDFKDVDIEVILSTKGEKRKVSVDCDAKLKRSLGGELKFSSSDISGFKKASAQEVESVFSNTNIKILLKDTEE